RRRYRNVTCMRPVRRWSFGGTMTDVTSAIPPAADAGRVADRASVQPTPRLTAEQLRHGIERIRDNVRRVISGKDEQIELALVVLLAEGHLLVEDVPGVGKTVLAKTLAASMSASVN